MSKFKKIEKEYMLTDSTVNTYGYRLLTSGYLMDEYKKNPIGYLMHKRDDGVLVKWEDFRLDGDQVWAKPVVNLSNPRGQQTVDEIESGFLNAASLGHFVVLGVSDRPEDYLEGQIGPSINKWYNRECSLVDIPGNYNALKELFDENDHPIKIENLADMKPQIKNMNKLFITPDQITKLNLKADADQAAVDTAISDLVAKAANVDTLTARIMVAETAKTTAENALTQFKTDAVKAKIDNLVATAITDKKITVEVGNSLKADYATNPEGLEKLLKSLTAYQPITSQLSADEATELGKLDWDALDKAGKLDDLKAKNIDIFKAKFKAKFNKEYTAA